MPFAQMVLGPPGSGKTTYCNGMQQFLQQNGRETVIVNMDPANEHLPYPFHPLLRQPPNWHCMPCISLCLSAVCLLDHALPAALCVAIADLCVYV